VARQVFFGFHYANDLWRAKHRAQQRYREESGDGGRSLRPFIVGAGRGEGRYRDQAPSQPTLDEHELVPSHEITPWIIFRYLT
jgi:hypothetical protein